MVNAAALTHGACSNSQPKPVAAMPITGRATAAPRRQAQHHRQNRAAGAGRDPLDAG